jgi:hypothetical protein
MIKAVPNAPRSEVVGWMGEVLKVKLKAPALEGKANAELGRFLAETLGLPRSQVELRAGETSRLKLILIHGLGQPEVLARLGRDVPPAPPTAGPTDR